MPNTKWLRATIRGQRVQLDPDYGAFILEVNEVDGKVRLVYSLSATGNATTAQIAGTHEIPGMYATSNALVA